MKIIKFEKPGSKEQKDEMIKNIQEHNKILLIAIGPKHKVTYTPYNISVFEALAAIEVTKAFIYDQFMESDDE